MGASNRIKTPEWLREAELVPCTYCATGKGQGFIEKNLAVIASFLKEVLESEGFADRKGLLQAIDPRARLSGVLMLMISGAILKSVMPLIVLLVFAFMAAIASRVTLSVLIRRVMPVAIFTFFLVLPSAFNFISHGTPVLWIFRWDSYDLYITAEGLEGIYIFLLRVVSMVSILSLFVLTTGYPDIFRALQSFPIPRFFIAALSMTFRYIIVLIRIAEDSHLAKKARTIKPLTLKEGHGWMASRIWLMMERSVEMAEGIHLAMAARGFNGDVKTMRVFEMKGRDYVWVGFAVFVLLLAVQL